MKLQGLTYVDPMSVSETIKLLNEYSGRAKILAGGQSLLPLLNSRLVNSEVLIDINHVKELHFLRNDQSGLTVGATIRQRELERFSGLADANPLLKDSLPLIGHFPIRNRGTVCGSLAQADPSAELPAVIMTVSAMLTVQSRSTMRIVAAEDFFVGPLETSMQPDELLVNVTFPIWNPNDGWAIEEFSRRQGDFALVGVVVLVRPDTDHRVCANARITVFGTGKKPLRVVRVERLLAGEPFSDRLLDLAVERLRAEVQAEDDVHASAEYRQHVAGALTRRALIRAVARAKLPTEGLNG